MVKKITKKDALRKEKLYNDQQVRALKEKEMMEWEEQFRGGHGQHSYYRGGTTMEDYPRHNLDMDRVLDSMSFVESTNNARAIGPKVKINDRFGAGNRWEKAHGQYQKWTSLANLSHQKCLVCYLESSLLERPNYPK